MNMKNFTISGYARFYRSLSRFCRKISDADAIKLTYDLYTAVIDSYRSKFPAVSITEYGRDDFEALVRKTDAEPYKTEIQLYRAMEAILHRLVIPAVRIESLHSVVDLTFMMSDTEMRFYKAFDMEIDDERTIYRVCARSLTPRRDEPGLCLLHDWLNAISV